MKRGETVTCQSCRQSVVVPAPIVSDDVRNTRSAQTEPVAESAAQTKKRSKSSSLTIVLHTLRLSPLIWIAVFFVIHFNLNHRYSREDIDPKEVSSDGVRVIRTDNGEMVLLTPTDFRQLTGTWHWRFFKWGVFYGDELTLSRMETADFWESLGMSTRNAYQWAKATAPGNPTPFMATLPLIAIALIANRVILKRRSRQSGVKALP